MQVRPYLTAVVLGVVVAGAATTVDALVKGGWTGGRTFAPQAVILAAPVISIFWSRRRRGIRSSHDRIGLLAVAALAAVLVVVGATMAAKGISTGQVVLSVVVVLLGAAVGFIGLSQLLGHADSTGRPQPGD